MVELCMTYVCNQQWDTQNNVNNKYGRISARAGVWYDIWCNPSDIWVKLAVIWSVVMCVNVAVLSSALLVADPVQPVRNGDVIQLIHGMTQRPLNRSPQCANKCIDLLFMHICDSLIISVIFCGSVTWFFNHASIRQSPNRLICNQYQITSEVKRV